MENDNLTKEAFLDLKHMFSDENFVTLLFTDEKEIAKNIKVNPNGSVVLGKTKYEIINRLFRDEKTLSPSDICIRIIKIITGKGGTRNSEAFKSLIEDLTIALDRGDYSYAITRIFIAYRLGYKSDIAEMRRAANKPDEIAVSPKYAMAVDGFGHPYAIKLGRYK